jgi:hypothetical protein
MVIGLFVLALVVTAFLTCVFWVHDFVVAFTVALSVLGFELIVAVPCGPAYLLGDYTCSKVAQKLEVEHDYDFFTGCFIKEGGRWVDYNKTRSIR